MKIAAKRAGLSETVSAHWLRHSHVSHALDRGAPVHLVQATVGHASLAATSRYAHARPTDSSSRYLPGSVSQVANASGLARPGAVRERPGQLRQHQVAEFGRRQDRHLGSSIVRVRPKWLDALSSSAIGCRQDA